MKILSKVIVLVTLFALSFSWTAFFEKVDQLKDKKEQIKERLDLKGFGLSHLKDISLNELASFKVPDLSAKLEKLKHIIPKDLDPSHHKDIDEFWTGAFESLKLPKPTELIECFGRESGQIFFRKLRILNEILRHSKEHKNLKLHVELAQFEMAMYALKNVHKCMFHSHDFERFTDTLHISNDPEVLREVKYLYYQAKYVELAKDFEVIIKEVDGNNFSKAGKLFGELFEKSAKDYKDQGENLLAYQAFGNGLSGTLGVALPSESVKCYDSENSKLLMDFFRGVSHSVTEGKWYKADESTSKYWEREGKDLLKKIPNKVWMCDMNSKDSKEISEKIEMDLNSKEFRENMSNYINEHNIAYYSYLKSMKSELDKGDYLHAGAVYAHLLQAVSKNLK